MTAPDPDVDTRALLDDTIAFLRVRPDADGDSRIWLGDAPSWTGPTLFGGLVISQAVFAATRAAPEGKRIHSLHGYFLRPVSAGPPVTYRIDTLRDGRSFASRLLTAEQSGAPVFFMSCSFTEDTEGYEYELPLIAPPPRPDSVETGAGPGAWEAAWLGPTEARADGTRLSTNRIWCRIPTRLSDDPHLHSALLAYVTDWTGTGGRPLHLDGDITGMVSLDHAVWFHRLARVDEWLYYDVHSLINAGGRGLLRGTIHTEDGRLVASVAQEMLLRPYAGP